MCRRRRKVHTREVCCVDRDTLADRAKRISRIVRSDCVRPIRQSCKSVAARAVRGRGRAGRSAQYHGRAAATRRRTNCPRDAVSRANLCRRGEVDSRDVRAIDRRGLTGGAECVTRVARRNRVRPICQTRKTVSSGAIGGRRGGFCSAQGQCRSVTSCRRTNRSRNTIGQSRSRSGEVRPRRNIRPVNRYRSATRAEGVTSVRGSNRIIPVRQSRKGVST